MRIRTLTPWICTYDDPLYGKPPTTIVIDPEVIAPWPYRAGHSSMAIRYCQVFRIDNRDGEL